MKRDESARLVKSLVAAFPGVRLDQENVDAYVGEFMRVDLETGELATEKAKDGAWWPSLGELRRLMRESRTHADLGKLGDAITEECRGMARLRGVTLHEMLRLHKAQCIENLSVVLDSYKGEQAAEHQAAPWRDRIAALVQMGV